jgi:hypothetical protein
MLALFRLSIARQLGLHSTVFLFPQIQSEQARQHLLIYQSIQADIRPIIPLILPFMLRQRRRKLDLTQSSLAHLVGCIR